MSKNNNKVLWYIHPYCGGPQIGPAFRPFYFCKEFSKANITPVIISPNWHHLMYNKDIKLKNQTIDGVHYYFINSKEYIGNGLQRMIHMALFPIKLFLNKELKSKYKPDVIISSSPHLFSFITAYLMSKKYNAKLILEVRDLWPLSITDITGVSRFHPGVIFLSMIEKFAYKKCNYLVTVLKDSKKYFSKFKINLDKVKYVPNGVLFESENKKNSLVESEDEIITYINNLKAKGSFVLGYAGAHGVPNCLDQMLEALLILKKENFENLDFILIGDGTEKKHLIKFCKYNQLSNVHFFDSVDKNRIEQIILSFDVCYISLSRSNLFKYGVSPNKMFEYMKASKPILSSIYYDSMVEKNNCGLVATPEDPLDLSIKIKSLFNMSNQELNNLGKNGYEYLLNNHSIKKLAKDYIKLF